MAAHLERIIRIYNRLRRGPVTIEILSKWVANAGIEVSDRQLYRDLNKLKTLQITEGENVIEFSDEKNRKTWKLEYKEEGGKLTAFDINSFFLLKNFAPYAILEERRTSIEKIEKVFYKSFSKNEFQKYIRANEMFLRATDYKQNRYGIAEHRLTEDLIWALHNSRCIIIEDTLINPANNKLVPNAFPLLMYPLELIFHRGRIHIAGVSKERKVLCFTIDKHFKFSLTNDSFKREKYISEYKESFSKRFGISEPANDKVYNIKLEFSEDYAESMKTFHWHHTAKWVRLKNGNYMMQLRCTIGRELVGFIAVGLDKIKVHQPKVLKDLVVKKFQQTLAINGIDLRETV